MSTSDLLTKLVLHEKQIVTYRTLSRQQSIHINQAKNDLAAFYHATKSSDASSIHATFIVTGLARPEPRPANGLAEDDMDLDIPSSSQPQEPEVGGWGTNRMVLCTEEALESTKAGFARVRSVHVYSLSAAPIKDSSILSTTLESVRKADASASQDQLRAFGIAIGDVSVISTKASGKGKKKAVEPPAPAVVEPAPEEKKVDLPEKKNSSRNGTLNFGNAKPKEEAKPVAKEIAVPVAKEKPKENVKKEEQERKAVKEPSPPAQPQRSSSGLIRKRGLILSEDEDDAPAAPAAKPTAPKARSTAMPKSKQRLPVKQEDEAEEDDDAPIRPGGRKTNGKSQRAKSAKEATLAAMFYESSDVDMQPAPSPEPVPKEEIEEISKDDMEAEDDEMNESEAQGIDKPKAKRRPKAKLKEGAIVMKDGKKKKRVVKSEMTTNDRGYMVMEDHSEYETVSESEELTVPPKPKKSTAKKDEKPKETVKEEVSKPKPKSKPTATSGGKKGGGKLMDYFNKK